MECIILSVDSSIIQIINQKLLEKAKEDGIVSNDEQAILDFVEMGLKHYEQKLELALSDGLLTYAEIEHLRKSRELITQQAWDIADKDITVTVEEKELIQTLVSLLRLLYP